MSETGTRIHPADSVSGGLFPTFTACDCGCSLGRSEVTTAESLQIYESVEKQQVQAIPGEAYELQASTSKSPGASLFHCRALLLHSPWPMRCCILLLLSTPVWEDYITQDNGPPKRMNGRERQHRKRISRGNVHPGRVKPLSTTLPNDSSSLGLTGVPKQHVNIQLLHSKLKPLKHKVIYLFLIRNLTWKL